MISTLLEPVAVLRGQVTHRGDHRAIERLVALLAGLFHLFGDELGARSVELGDPLLDAIALRSPATLPGATEAEVESAARACEGISYSAVP